MVKCEYKSFDFLIFRMSKLPNSNVKASFIAEMNIRIEKLEDKTVQTRSENR